MVRIKLIIFICGIIIAIGNHLGNKFAMTMTPIGIHKLKSFLLNTLASLHRYTRLPEQ